MKVGAFPMSNPALLKTKNIRVSPSGDMLPYHHLVELAHRIVCLGGTP